MKNQQFELNDFNEMTPYQVFVSSLFRMGRDTKLLSRNGVKSGEIPKISLVSYRNDIVELTYLSDSKVWGISTNNCPVMHFNPTTYNGILHFMADFEPSQLKAACLKMVVDFETIIENHAITRLSGEAKQSMAS
jgi:hypothetical protein